MKNSLITTTLLICIICSCNHADKDATYPVIRFQSEEQLFLSEYFSELSYVFLEKHGESLFARADQIFIRRDNLFIVDFTLNAVLCFDTSGTFRYRIQRPGRGPGEYRELDACWLNPAGDKLYLHCQFPDHTLVFNTDGVLIDEFSGNRGASARVTLPGGDLLSYTLYKSGFGRDTVGQGVFLSDKEGIFTRQILTHGDQTPYWQTHTYKQFAQIGDTSYLISQSDSILSYDSNGNQQVDCLIDWGTRHADPDLRTIAWESPRLGDLSELDVFTWKDYLLVTGELRWFHCGKRNEYHYAIGNTRTGSGRYTQTLVNDLGVLPVTFPIGQSDCGDLISMIGMDLIWAMKENLIMQDTTENKTHGFLQTLSFVNRAIRDDRPVVVRMKLIHELIN